MSEDVYADVDLIDDGIDEADPPEDEVEDYPDDEDQNTPEGEEVELPEPESDEEGEEV